MYAVHALYSFKADLALPIARAYLVGGNLLGLGRHPQSLDLRLHGTLSHAALWPPLVPLSNVQAVEGTCSQLRSLLHALSC